MTSIDNLAEEIMQGLQEYADLADTAMKKAVRKSATQVKNEISANAPKDTGKYAKSWATKKTGENSHSLEMTVYKLGTAIKISEELLNDSVFDLPSYIAKEFARRIGAKEEEAFFVGDGKGKPTGIFNATGGAEDGTSTTGASITFDDVMELFYSLRSPYRKKAVWVLNDSTVKALRKLKDNTGNYIWSPSVQAGVPDTILNRPYKTSSYVPEIKAGNKCMAFGDFSYYWVADRQGRSFKRLNELFAMTGQVGFLASQRLDGKLILPEAIKTLTIKKA